MRERREKFLRLAQQNLAKGGPMVNLHYGEAANGDDLTARFAEELAHNEQLRSAITDRVRAAIEKGLERKDSPALECGMRVTPHDREDPRA